MNISFFGASVTGQKTGYVHHFKNHAESDKYDFNITIHGYGSMHIKDAGMCFIDSVLEDNPNYCLIDWFSTAYIPSESELKVYLDTFRFKLIPHCQIVFLLLGGSESHMSDKRADMYKQVIEYSVENEIPYIEVHEHVRQFSTLDLYRDSVHTLDFGSKLYGDFIYKSFIENTLPKQDRNYSNIRKTKYSEIKKIILSEEIIYDQASIVGNAEIVGLHQNIGPYSGILNINADGNESKQNLWDCWCYYERKVLKIAKKFQNKLLIKVSQEDFDRSSAKQQVDWSMDKVIKPSGFLYFVGDILDINYK